MKTESNGPQASGGGILSRLDPRVAQLIRPLAYALGITVVVFGVYEVVERVWLTEVEMHILHLLHILRGAVSTLLVAGVFGWMILKSSPGFLGATRRDEDWDQQPRISEAERLKIDTQWFIAMRWIAVLIAGLLVFIIVRVVKWLPMEVWWPLVSLVGLLAACNLVYMVLLHRNRASPGLLQAQAYLDLAILTGLLHFSGGVENPLSIMMLFHVVIAGVLLSRGQCYAIAAAASVLFAGMVWAEWAGGIPHYTLGVFPHFEHPDGDLLHAGHDSAYALSRAGLQAAVLFLTAYFVATLAQRLRENEDRLETLATRALAGQQLLEQALQTSGTGLRVLNQDLEALWSNARWSEWFDCLSGMSCKGFELLNGPDSPAGQTLSDGQVRVTELVLEQAEICTGGPLATTSERAFQVTTAPLRGLSGAIQQIVELAQDITAQKKHQAQLIRAGKLAAVGELAGQVAHEVNNPIAILSAKAKLLLLDHKEEMSPVVAGELDKISALAARVARIAQGLLSSCRPSAGNRVLLDVRVPIGKSLVLLEEHAQRCGVRIEEQFPEKLPPILGNAQELEQVFLNLILNALDAMPKGGWLKVYSPPELVELGDGRPALAIRVEDTGGGIPEAIRERIFEPFFTTKKEGRGTGLGLSICMGLVRSHGGEIDLTSKLWRGTCLTVKLPVASPAQPANENHGKTTNPGRG